MPNPIGELRGYAPIGMLENWNVGIMVKKKFCPF